MSFVLVYVHFKANLYFGVDLYPMGLIFGILWFVDLRKVQQENLINVILFDTRNR